MRKLISLLITAVVLAGLWLALKPPVIEPNQAQPAIPQTTTEPAAAKPARLVLEISNAVVNGPAAFKVQQDEVVDIQITSDEADEVHLHGYDLHAELQPGIAAHLRFTADKSGRFELELHRRHHSIGVLEVYPSP
jgi:anion-transporting  ArsA/GET3 family ATPase